MQDYMKYRVGRDPVAEEQRRPSAREEYPEPNFYVKADFFINPEEREAFIIVPQTGEGSLYNKVTCE
ncbi:MAG: hypothetical protein JRJ78_14655 [Deltaproteobacteria bacterium]|nr:hypothetical protein [Deltaproteobacteria bacterium]